MDLALVAVATTLAWDRLMAVYPAVRDGAGAAEVRAALWAMLLTAGVAALVYALTSLLEVRAGPLDRRWIRRISLGIALLVLMGTVLGAVGLERRVGDLGAFAQRSWEQFTSDTGPAAESSSRFRDVGLNGRLQLWRASADAFALHPVLGVGAQNFESFFYQHRISTLSVRQPHSQPMQLLGELGLPGLLLWLFLAVGVMARAAVLRFRGGKDKHTLLLATMIVAFLSWFVHSSVDWLWQLGGVSWPALLLLGGLLASGSPTARPATHNRAWGRAGRWVAGVLVSLILVSAALSYLATVYNDASQVNAGLSPTAALANARTAARFDLLSPLPAIRQAEAYTAAAKQAAAGTAPGRAWPALDDLALACASWDEALQKEPDNWVSAYRGAVAALDYRDAARAAGVLPPGNGARSSAAASSSPDPWAGLRSSDALVGRSDPGAQTASLAVSAEERAAVARFRALDAAELADLAMKYLGIAQQLNPLGTEVRRALDRV